MAKIKFVKMEGAGNDFVVIDNRKNALRMNKTSYSELAKRLCSRKFSVGADGLLVLEPSKAQTFKMVYYNSDGSQAAMCGNGARCIAYYGYVANKLDKTAEILPVKLSLETLAGTINAHILLTKNLYHGTVRLHLPDPQNIRLNFPLKVGQREFDASFINTGVPHTVVFVSQVKKVNVQELGRSIRNHRDFLPEGANVNFVEKNNSEQNTLYIRTYERGVEDETFACGTGATASAIIAGMNKLVKSPVKCITTGGEILTIHFNIDEKENLLNPVYNVQLEGNVQISFTGEVI